MKLKAFTPTQLKGDLAFIGALIAVFGFNIPNSISVAIVGSGALVCVILNASEKLAEAHVHVGATLSATITRALSEFKALLPDIQAAVASLPGNVAKEVSKAIELAEKGPVADDGPKALKGSK